MRRFDFSVVIAVYNTASFLGETVQSVIRQNHGFSRIQLVLCDDGSTDGSAELCDCYREQYPDNIVVIHKENGGVSSARNTGLRAAEGKYINFLDSDDKLSPNVMTEAYAFLESHLETDVVAIPMFYFDGGEGSHPLNTKFERGTRVIDLSAEPVSQLSAASAFFRASAMNGESFDTRLKYMEDAKFVQTVLIKKQTLGVIAGASYFCRKRSSGEASAQQKSHEQKDTFISTQECFALELIQNCREQLGYVPRFVMNTIAYDLQWKVRISRIKNAVLSEREQIVFQNLLKQIYSYLDDDLILSQSYYAVWYKLFALFLKHGKMPHFYGFHKTGSDRGQRLKWRIGFDHEESLEIDGPDLRAEFLNVGSNGIRVECSTMRSLYLQNGPELIAICSGEEYRADSVLCIKREYSNGIPVAEKTVYSFIIPLETEQLPLKIGFIWKTDREACAVPVLEFGPYSLISDDYETSYAVRDGYVLTREGACIRIAQAAEKRFRSELSFLCELLRKRKYQAVMGRLFAWILKPFVRKQIWLISDRFDRADDNGEALFRYLCEKKPREIKAYFVIEKTSPDYQRIKKIGRTVGLGSYRNKLLFLLADYNISAHADGLIPTPFGKHEKAYRDYRENTRFIFLQHGITKDDLSGWLNRFEKNIAGFVTAAEKEAESIRSGSYYYPPEAVWLTGFPRHDLLYRNEKRCITIMPTWRKALICEVNRKRFLKSGYEDSAYYRFFNRLINDERITAAAGRIGYTVRFLPHPNMQPFNDRFNHSGRVTFLPQGTKYRDVFAESDLILTDYSSVAFDFAYLRKPVIYAQFDREEFFSGEHMYTRGYYDYERDGFGEVETEYEGTVLRLIEYMENGCRLKDVYRDRIDSFFAFSDQNNCRRVYEKIRELGGL